MTFVSTDSAKAKSVVWLTPLSLINALGEFDLDPCGHNGHKTAKKIICPPDDGFEAEWSGRVWLNPPYGKEAERWVSKLAIHGNGIAILFARLEAKWLRQFLGGGFFVLEKRVRFLTSSFDYKDNAGTGSILLPFGRKNIGAILSSDLGGEWYQ